MVRKFVAVALLAATSALSAPASAVTFDALSSFNAAQGNGGFTYGTYNGTTFTAFTQNTGCALAGTTCLRGASSSTPSVFKADGSRTSDGTVSLPTDSLIGLPGQTNNALFVGYTAQFAGTFNYSVVFNQLDSNAPPSSVKIIEFFRPVSGPAEFYDAGIVDQSGVVTGFTQTVAAGDIIGYIIDNNGSAMNDATGFNFTLNADAPAVPEPASWAMMIVGMGLAGGALRRRGVAKTAHA